MIAIHRATVMLAAILFVGLGLWLVLQPGAVEALYPITFEGPMAASEMRAVFGGMMLGIGAATLWLDLRARRVRDAGAVMLLVFGGLLVARVAGLVGEGVPTGPVLNETVFEIVYFAALGALTLATRDRA